MNERRRVQTSVTASSLSRVGKFVTAPSAPNDPEDAGTTGGDPDDGEVTELEETRYQARPSNPASTRPPRYGLLGAVVALVLLAVGVSWAFLKRNDDRSSYCQDLAVSIDIATALPTQRDVPQRVLPPLSAIAPTVPQQSAEAYARQFDKVIDRYQWRVGADVSDFQERREAAIQELNDRWAAWATTWRSTVLLGEDCASAV